MKIAFDIRMEDLVKRYDQYLDLHKPVVYMRNGLGHGSPVSCIQA